MGRKLRTLENHGLSWYCPGCQCSHWVNLREVTGDEVKVPVWKFDGNFEAPTITPSVRVVKKPTVIACHCYITLGHIQFLEDCEHQYAGKTIPMEDVNQNG